MKQVKRRFSNEVIFEYEDNLKEAIKKWLVENYSNLSDCNLSYSDLSYCNLSDCNLSHSNLSYSDLSHSYNADRSGRIHAMQHGKYRLVMLDKSILWGGCTKKSVKEWLEYSGDELNEYDKNYLETITKPFIRMICGDI